jgi:hypothetical protein
MGPRLDSEEERGGIVALPAFQVGGRVERTGLALVHEGEYIVPAAGSEAEISSATEQAGRVVNYYFPVEVEIVGELGPEHMEAVAQYVYDDLTNQLDGASQG